MYIQCIALCWWLPFTLRTKKWGATATLLWHLCTKNEEQKTKSKKRSKIKRSKKMRSDPNLAALYNSERQGSNQFGMKINENWEKCEKCTCTLLKGVSVLSLCLSHPEIVNVLWLTQMSVGFLFLVISYLFPVHFDDSTGTSYMCLYGVKLPNKIVAVKNGSKWNWFFQ